jgi:hypothetical protein
MRGSLLAQKTNDFWRLSLTWNNRPGGDPEVVTFQDMDYSIAQLQSTIHQPRLVQRVNQLFDEVIQQGQKWDPDTSKLGSVVPLPDRRMWLEAALQRAQDMATRNTAT